MKIKTIINIFLIIVCTQTASGINWYQKGDSLFIWAESGLNLRSEKNVKSDILKTIPYGSKVITLEEKWFGERNDPNFSIELFGRIPTKENNRFKLEGKWVKVKHGKEVGYVFDAFLSKFQALKEIHYENSFNNDEKYYEPITQFLKRIDKDLNFEEIKIKEWEDLKIEKWTSKKGIIIQEISSIGRASTEIILTGFSKEEAFLIFNQIYNIEEVMKQRIEFGGEETSESSNSLHLRLNEISYASLNKYGNTVIIKISASD